MWSTDSWVPFGLNGSFEDVRSTHTMAGAGLRWRPKKTLRDYQEAAVTAMLRDEQGLLRQSAGCISGDALISLSRAGKGFKAPLERVVASFNGGATKGHRWDRSIPTLIRAPFADGSVRLARLIDARSSGKKPIFRLSLHEAVGRGVKPGWRSEGFEPHLFRFVKATGNHRFLTPFGWVEMRDLVVGDFVMVEGGFPTGRGAKSYYPSRAVPNHPHAASRGRGKIYVPTHRLVAEAALNEMTLEVFIAAIAAGASGLRFLNPREYVVHHKDENSRNYALENLEVLTPDQHRKEHRECSVRNLTSRLVPAEVKAIDFVGEEETYDLEVEDAHGAGDQVLALAREVGDLVVVLIRGQVRANFR